MTRSYRDEWQEWGITTALQMLLLYAKPPYTVLDVMQVAKDYGVEEDLLKRISYVPDTLENYIIE